MKKIDLACIKQFADGIIHCGDYGSTYVSRDLKEVCLVLGDADDPPELEDFEEMLLSINIAFNILDESHPGDDFILISRGIVDLGGDELEPEVLSLDEYSEFLQLMERLDV